MALMKTSVKKCPDSGAVAGLKDPVCSFELLRRSKARFGSSINGKDLGYKFMHRFGKSRQIQAARGDLVLGRGVAVGLG
jgi:hypothetical protein